MLNDAIVVIYLGHTGPTNDLMISTNGRDHPALLRAGPKVIKKILSSKKAVWRPRKYLLIFASILLPNKLAMNYSLHYQFWPFPITLWQSNIAKETPNQKHSDFPIRRNALPAVPARGGAEVALGIVIYRTCTRRAPARRVRACFVRSCCTVVVQEHDLRRTPAQCNAKQTLSSHFTLHSSHFTLALHTPHFISSHLIWAFLTSSRLTSSQLFSSHPISSHMSSK